MAAGDGEVSAGSNPLGMISSLLTLMNQGRGATSGTNTTSTQTTDGGGGVTTVSGYSSPGDTAALRALLGELGQADYTKLLESIFSQAGGKIPGFQAGLQNALGARSGSNSSVAAVLQKLLQDTVLQGQQQVVNAQLQNANIRGNLAQGIAQATKGTHQRQVTNQQARPQRVVTQQVQTPLKQSYDGADALKLIGVLSAGKGIFGELLSGGSKDRQSGNGVPVIDAQPSWLAPAVANPTADLFSGNGLIASPTGQFTPASAGMGDISRMNFAGAPQQYTFSAPQSYGFQGNAGYFGGMNDFSGFDNFDYGSIGNWNLGDNLYSFTNGDYDFGGVGLDVPSFSAGDYTPGDYSLVPAGGAGGIGLQFGADDWNWF